MNPYFSNVGRVLALEIQAQDWLGTPFFPNSQSKRVGVSCHKLAAALYRDAGWRNIDVPEVPMSHARFSRESLVEQWLDVRPEFVSVSDPMPGDLLGFRIAKVVHHVGVMLRDGRFAHCIEGVGTQFGHIEDATWSGRLARIWRPIE